MIATLVRTDPARRLLPFFLGGGALAGLVLRGVRSAIPGGIPAGSVGAAALVVILLAASAWAVALSFLMMARIQTRGNVLSLGLPLPARTVWLARMFAIAGAAAAPMAAMTAVAAFGWDAGAGLTVHGPSVALGVRLLASLLLLVAIVQTDRPERQDLPWTRRSVARFVFALAMAFAVAFAPVHAGLMSGAALVAAGLLGLGTFRRIPPAFSWAGSELAPAVSARPVPAAGRGGKAVLRSTVVRVLVKHAAAWFILPVLALYGFQTMLAHREGTDILLVLIFPTIWIPFVALHSMSRIGPLDPLPIPRRTLFRWIVFPPLAAYLAGLALFVPIAHLLPEERALVRLHRNGVRTPLEFWEFATGGAPPPVVAPWGESHAPTARRLLPGIEAAVYFPFSAPREASPRYAAWQARRALAAVHGGDPAAVPAPDAGDPLLERMDTRGSIRSTENLADSIGAPSATHVGTLLILALGPVAFWLVFGWMGMAPGLSGRARGVLLALGLGLPVVAVVGTELAAIASGVPSSPLSIAAVLTARKVSDILPLGPVPLAGVLAAAGVAVYAALGRMFERFEAPRRPVRNCVTGWSGPE